MAIIKYLWLVVKDAVSKSLVLGDYNDGRNPGGKVPACIKC